MVRSDIEKFLLQVEKPGRYVGGEPNSVVKEKSGVNIRFAFCFPFPTCGVKGCLPRGRTWRRKCGSIRFRSTDWKAAIP